MMRAIALTGPTAVGKTALSLTLATLYSCEILSLDSMQIYRGMDIGTAKVTAEERGTIVHHLMDICEPTQSFSAADYAEAALAVMQDVTARDRVPLFVGGTGLYLSTLLRGEAATPASDPAYHEMRLRQAKEQGAQALYEELCRKDPVSASAMHANNVRRVIRALEIYDKTGIPKSQFDAQSRLCEPRIELCHITLTVHDRERLYERTDARVDAMVEAGLVEEVRALYASGRLLEGTTAAQAIGYKEMLAYVLGYESLDACIARLKLSTRHYVKRQLTWFSHCPEAHPVFVDREDGTPASREHVIAEIARLLNDHGFTPTQNLY
ncbi:MAG: tRNA (adenosine(37)-N6)-dimethylallyltransferase MiaA [Clostridia bacterium]|nr:tRNA (adenosine(37)-N6)-dimethylallyltransferase MiaA [Clostridia bacterium]